MYYRIVHRALSAILYTAATALMGIAAVDAGRLAWADWVAATDTPESVAEAVRLDPRNAAFHGLLAEHQEAAGKDPKPELKAAAALSPAESRYWARLAFRAETEHDDEDAEKYLLHAAEVDRMFAPRWALANFYLRRGDRTNGDIDNFWKWLRKSFEMPPPELGALFQVGWAVSPDGSGLRAILPQDHSVLRQYVDWLVENRPAGDAVEPALELAGQGDETDVSTLLTFCDKVTPMDAHGTLQVWNSMCRRKLLPYPELDPAAAPVVTNGGFTRPPLQRGFDWRLIQATGASEALAESGAGLVIQLSGKEAERTVLLMQPIPLASGKRYRISFEYRVTGGGGATGLHWELPQAPGDANLLAAAPHMIATGWTTGQADFQSGLESAAHLMLVYQREPGMIPWEGTLYLRKVAVEAAP